MKKHAGNVMADLLAGYGVDTVFGLPGGQSLALYYGIADRKDIKTVLVRDENNAVMAADCYARISGKIGACVGTAGCAPVKYLSGLAEAYNSSVPLIAFAAEQNSKWLVEKYRGCGPQETDCKAILKPVTKSQLTLTETKRAAEIVQHSAQVAMAGRPGPVYVEVPYDLWDAEYDGPEYKADPALSHIPPYRMVASKEDLAKAVDALKGAKAPMMLAGGGCWLSRATDEIVKIAEKLNMPVATTLTGKGVMPENHPLSMGVLAVIGGTDVAKEMIKKADVVLCVGFKFSQMGTLGWTVPTADQKVVQIDIDSAEIGKKHDVVAGLVGDAKATLEALLDAIDFEKKNDAILKELKEAKEAWNQKRLADATPKTPITPQQVVTVLNEICDDNTIICCDASFSCGWAAAYFDVYGNRRVTMPRGMSGLGYGLPSALGAAAARPDANVIVLTGDGGFSYCLGELASIKEQNFNVKVLVLNNSILGWIKWYEAAIWDGRFNSVDTTHIDFAKVASGFGLDNYNLSDSKTLKEDLKKILSKKGPALVDMITSETDACKFNDNPTAVKYVEDSFKAKKGLK